MLRELCELGWTIARSRREARLDDRTIHVPVADGWRGSHGSRISGYMSDEDVALTLDQRMALMPCMLANARKETA